MQGDGIPECFFKDRFSLIWCQTLPVNRFSHDRGELIPQEIWSVKIIMRRSLG
jgi:hypothetical protein